MLVKNIGEFEIIERIKKRCKVAYPLIKGIGDDAAVVELDKKRLLLLTTDMLVEGVHFKRTSPAEAIGRKAISVSLSDIAAMGGQPLFALVSIGFPPTTKVNKVDRIYTGIISRSSRFKVKIVGGDTVRAERLVINTTLVGEVQKKALLTRSNAKPKDIIFVSGPLGASGKFNRHLDFIPPLEESRFLVKNFTINSMIDLSDGLFSDLEKICKESRVGAVLYEALIPLNRGANIRQALYEGEDFKLLFTASRELLKKISVCRSYRFFPIGEILDRTQGLALIKKGPGLKEIKLIDKSFKHFK